MEIGAFVSPKWVPQMKDSDKVAKSIFKSVPENIGTHLSALVPNMQGYTVAEKSGFRELAVFTSCSESFSRKNINCSIEESFARFEPIFADCKKKKIKVRAYLSAVFGCPYEGKVDVSRVVANVEKFVKMGAYEISLGDTIGVATPRQIEMVLKEVMQSCSIQKLALHCHDTRGTALSNVVTGLEMGIHTFDSSVGGMGGCPYAKGASGNLATEDLIYQLQGMGVQSQIDLGELIKTTKWLEKILKRKLPSRMSQAGLTKHNYF